MSANPNHWLLFATSDLRIAELALADKIYHQACFHAQQCAEKSLKGIFAQTMKTAPPRTHSIADLVNRLPQGLQEKLDLEALSVLDNFYIPTRYPDALPGALPDSLPNEEDAKEAFAIAKAVLAIAQQMLA
jgi:HEPN domain-containing protein